MYLCTRLIESEDMILKEISMNNYRNIETATLQLSPKMNCFTGRNGAGKTNFLDAVYYLSFCKSASGSLDSQVVRHGADYFVLDAIYDDEQGEEEKINCGMKIGSGKRFRRNGKAYKRLSEHIGHIPLIMVSPSDTLLITGSGEERRRFLDMVISQYDHTYLEALNFYNRALQQRNALLRSEQEPDIDILEVLEQQMADAGEKIYEKRDLFVKQLLPLFQEIYQRISEGSEQVSLRYVSHCQRGPLLEVIQRDRAKDRIVGHSLHGVHRDDLEMLLAEYPVKREGSQGQHKTFSIALKLAQYDFLRRVSGRGEPLLLLDDVFDKLDDRRVSQIIELVAGDNFGQIFITDTNQQRMRDILQRGASDYRVYHVEGGQLQLVKRSEFV